MVEYGGIWDYMMSVYVVNMVVTLYVVNEDPMNVVSILLNQQ